MKFSDWIPAVFAGGLQAGLVGGGLLFLAGVPAVAALAIAFVAGTLAARHLFTRI